MSVQNLEVFISRFLSGLHLEMLIHGNMMRESAESLAARVQERLTTQALTRPLLPSQLMRQREYQLREGRIVHKGNCHTFVHTHWNYKFMHHQWQNIFSLVSKYWQMSNITGSSSVYVAENAVHRISAVETYFQCGQQGTHQNMLLELLCQIFAEPAFDELRTKVCIV